MSEKPTYGELEQRIRELEQAEAERKQVEEGFLETEEKFRLLADNSVDMISRHAADGTVLFVSPSCESLSGYTADEVVGKSAEFFVFPDDIEKVWDVINNLQVSEDRYVVEHRLPRKDGSIIWVETMGRLFRDMSGNLTEIQCNVRDITDRKQAENALRESMERLDLAIKGANLGMWDWDIKTGDLAINEQWTKMLGYKPDELKLHINTLLDLMHPDDMVSVVEVLEQHFKNDQFEYNTNFRLKTKTGGWKWFNSRGKVFERDQEKKPLRMVGVHFDITEQKLSEKTLRESEEKFSKIFHCGPAIAGISDLETGEYVEVNQAFYNKLGFTTNEVIRKKSTEVVRMDEKLRASLIAKMKKQGQIKNEEGIIYTKNGTPMNVLFSAEVIELADKGYNYATAIDITDHKRIEKALKESEEKFKILFENAPDAYYLNDLEGNFIDGNKAAEELIGYKRDELIGKNFLGVDIVPPEQIPKASKIFEKGFSEQRGGSEELTLKRKDGSNVSLEISSIPIKLNGKKVFVGIARDITERKHLEESLRQAQKLEAIGTLAGGIAHDFNNILSAIWGYTELSLSHTEPETLIHGNLSKVLKASKRARDLVQQILTFSLQGNRELRAVQIRQSVKEVMKFIRATLPTSIEIRQKLKSNSAVMADPTQIHQIIMNLCTNAGYAMQEKGGILEIEFENLELASGFTEKYPGLKPGNHIKLTVSDTGTGIPSENLERIFDPYFTTKEKEKGTGLGLATVHGIVKSHKGVVLVKSRIGEGTTFEVYLPSVVGSREKREHSESQLIGGKERILLVDDEFDIIEIQKLMLDKLGYKVTATDKANEALEIFSEQPDQFDLVISDMTMPEITGDLLAKKLIKIRSDILFILCTGFSEGMSDEKAKSLGIRGLLMKPVIMKDLSNLVRKVLDEKRS